MGDDAFPCPVCPANLSACKFTESVGFGKKSGQKMHITGGNEQ